MEAFLEVADFGLEGLPAGPLTRKYLIGCRSELLTDALACFRRELALLDMLFVALLSDHHMGGEIGSLLFRWCFMRDRVIAEFIIARGLRIKANPSFFGGHLV